MIRSELIARLTGRYPQLTQKDSELVVAEILDAIQTTLAESVKNFVWWKSLANFTASSQVHGKSVGE